MNEPLEDLMIKTFSRYLRVLPQGFEIYPDHVEEVITAKLYNFSSARSLYENKKLVCRSLNAIHDLKNKCECASCQNRIKCTPQIYLELEYDQVPVRLILSYTSARNFMSFCTQVKQRELSIIEMSFQLRVLDRGRWGEVRFFLP